VVGLSLYVGADMRRSTAFGWHRVRPAPIPRVRIR
jgi:hypothetical protein